MGRREKLESVLLSTRRDLSFRAQKAMRRAQWPPEELAALPQLLGEERRGVAVEYAYDVADLMLKERALSPEERQREDHE